MKVIKVEHEKDPIVVEFKYSEALKIRDSIGPTCLANREEWFNGRNMISNSNDVFSILYDVLDTEIEKKNKGDDKDE